MTRTRTPHVNRADYYWRARAATELRKQITAIKAHRASLETLSVRIANRCQDVDAAIAKLRSVVDDLTGLQP